MNAFIHKTTVVYLAVVILLRMMAMPISLIDFSLNKKFIASNFCENRLKPAIHCSGKCFLKKQLTKANDGQDSREQKGNFKNVIVDFFEPVNQPSFGCKGAGSGIPVSSKVQPVISPYLGNIFHPPIV
jgi:hypothetical protein